MAGKVIAHAEEAVQEKFGRAQDLNQAGVEAEVRRALEDKGPRKYHGYTFGGWTASYACCCRGADNDANGV
jgi:hypothetical protein